MAYFLLTVVFVAVFALIAWSKEIVGDAEKKFWFGAACVVLFVFLFLINYNAMPVLQWWGFEGVWVEGALVAILGILAFFAFDEGESNSMWWKIKSIPTVIVVVAFILGCVNSCEPFNAKTFNERMKVTEVNKETFGKNIAVVEVEKTRALDEEVAKRVGNDVVGNNTALGSRAEVGNPTLQCLSGSFTIDNGEKLTFNNDLVYVMPLEHTSFFKWWSYDTTPGYIIVSASDQNWRRLVTEVNGHKLALRYLESAYFSDDIERHIKFNGYLHKGLNDHCFEIDNNGRPYWVLSSYDQKIGFCGEESEGPITVDAQTGEIKAYTIKNAPKWIDRIQPKNFIEEQIRQWGEYKLGWWNSCPWASQLGVLEPTPGMSLVYSNGRSYWYTGIKSANKDKGTNGFMLVDTRTKEAKFYRSPGFNEEEARGIADGQQWAKSADFKADFPVLYNVRGVPTYFMTYKDATGNIQGYCFLSSINRDAVGCGKLKTEASRKYEEMLKTVGNDKLKDSEVKAEVLTGTVRDIVLEGDVYYVLLNEKSGFEFSGKSVNFPELKWSKKGDKVKVSFKIGEEKVVPLDSFDVVGFEI
ncbi:MAG: hypothetical protein IJ564_01105 [Alphaproteobacteria bacterium]|nr:hypothetical protein [Alphaproteobacteria bacterium]